MITFRISTIVNILNSSVTGLECAKSIFPMVLFLEYYKIKRVYHLIIDKKNSGKNLLISDLLFFPVTIYTFLVVFALLFKISCQLNS